jgi:hypothetical protein
MGRWITSWFGRLSCDKVEDQFHHFEHRIENSSCSASRRIGIHLVDHHHHFPDKVILLNGIRDLGTAIQAICIASLRFSIVFESCMSGTIMDIDKQPTHKNRMWNLPWNFESHQTALSWSRFPSGKGNDRRNCSDILIKRLSGREERWSCFAPNMI